MRLMNIASGSGGNATYVGNSDTHILIDTGVSRKKIIEGLKKLDIGLSDLTAVLITHEHTDHICSLGTIKKTADIPVFATKGTALGIENKTGLSYNKGDLFIISSAEQFTIGSISVNAFDISHDANEPVCFRFADRTSACGIVTDLGCFDNYLADAFQNLDVLLIESNHDIRMLQAGPYPYPLKQRISGRSGHLSNDDAGRLLSSLLHDRMKYIALGHLSKQNNYADLASITVKECIDHYSEYSSGDFRIDVAGQDTGTDIYDF